MNQSLRPVSELGIYLCSLHVCTPLAVKRKTTRVGDDEEGGILVFHTIVVGQQVWTMPEKARSTSEGRNEVIILVRGHSSAGDDEYLPIADTGMGYGPLREHQIDLFIFCEKMKTALVTPRP
jgi:hypothetical protein